MDLRIILALHVCIDIALCAVILMLLRKVAILTRDGGREGDAPVWQDTASISKKATPLSFVETLDSTLTDSHPEKKDGVPAEKMPRVRKGKGWLKRIMNFFPGRDASQDSMSSERYRAAVNLASQGVSLERIAAELGLTEGEISLVLDLDRTRNESR